MKHTTIFKSLLIAALSLCSVEGFATSYGTCKSWVAVINSISKYDYIHYRPFSSSSTYNRIDGTVYVSHTVTLDLCGYSPERHTSYSAIVVQNGGVLTLTNGTLDGEVYHASNPLIVVQNGGKLILQASLRGAYLTGAQDGAAIRIESGGTVEMQSGTICNYSVPQGSGAAVFNNGGKFTMSGGTIYYCYGGSASAMGGAIRNNGTFTMSGGTITNCGCTSDDQNYTTQGGAVYNFAGKTFTMSGGTISSCSADQAGGVYNAGTFNMSGVAAITGCSGGGVWSTGTTDIHGTENASNGSCWLQSNSNFYGGGLCVKGGTTTVKWCNIYQNTGDAGSQVACIGGTLNLGAHANLDASVSSARGALFVEGSSSVVNMSAGDIKNSTSYSGWPGAGVTVYSGTFNMTGGEIYNNKATGDVGGGIYTHPKGSGIINISGGEIKNNSATKGGGIYSTKTATISGGKIHDNTVSDGGGGVFVQSGTMTLSGGEIYSNSAQYGGGVRCAGGTTTLSGTKIYSNRAYGNGDGVQLHGDLTFNMTGGEIYGNYDYNAVQYGGGGILAWENVKLNISGGKIYNNTTSGNGGAIHMGQNSKVTITGGEIYGNKSGGNSTYSGSGTPSGGIFHNSSDSLILGDAAKVWRNFKSDGTTASNIYIPKDKIITIKSALAATDTIGVTTATKPTTSASVVFSGESNESDPARFRSDNSIYKVERNTSGKLELCGYRLTLDGNGADCSTSFVRTIEGQACPTLPELTKTGMYSPGWYLASQENEGTAIPSDKKIFSGMTIAHSKDTTAYCWWKKISYEDITDPAGVKETISKELVTTDDVLYTLNEAEKNKEIENIAVIDMSTAGGIVSVEEIVDAVHNSTKATPNTLIYLPVGTVVPADKAENVVVKDTTGQKTTYRCENFSVTDGNPLSVPYSFSADVATYKRDSSYCWGTICVPYKLASDDNIQFYTAGKKYNDQLLLEKADTVKAGCPAIYQVLGLTGSNRQDIVKTDYVKDVVSTTSTSGDGSDIKIGGTLTKLLIDETKAASEGFSGNDIYYYQGNTFYKREQDQNVTIPALRAYILIQKAQ